ncbi:MAG TPA: type III pantothenate kinase [Opitutaceae bacterium]|nr:type III pantothenate kinase [Opitutaceae bacterium]
MRVLLLTIGNTSLAGGIIDLGRLERRFRTPVADVKTGVKLRRFVGAEARGAFDRVALCSVVPELTLPLCAAAKHATGLAPRVLRAESAHGLTIGYKRPRELGADRVAAALGAHTSFPGRDRIVIDFGTATTVTAVTATGVVAGGAILPGFGLWGEMLATRTAQLPKVGGAAPQSAVGRSPHEAIAAGLHFGHVGAVRELVGRISQEIYGRKRPLVLATGGNAARFSRDNLFAELVPDLILLGLHAFAYA